MQNNRINQWLENSYKGLVNSELIVFKIAQNHTNYNLLDLRNIADAYLSNINVVMLDSIQRCYYFKNAIIVTSATEYKTFEYMKKIVQRDVILVEDGESINKMIYLLKNKQLDQNSEIKYHLLEKVKFEDIVYLDTNVIREFVIARTHLLKKLNIYFKDLDIEYVDTCLNIYKHKKVLLARFAQSLYRLATLDFTSTDKSVGGTIHKTLGVGSKVLSMKSLKIIVPTSMNKNHRAYDLNENQIETNIKIDIAKKLILLKCKTLDIEQIASTVKLPVKKVEKMYSEFFIK
ncbi:MAG: hypothetical protein C0627_11075 [Sulfurimonas sp.]|nr:MAG: hypothetical protein C0627_11075 [Sulfurimonas sp.]